MTYEKEEISDLRWLGRRMDNLYRFILENFPYMSDYFIDTIGVSFEMLISNALTQVEEDYLFDHINDQIDYFKETHSTTF